MKTKPAAKARILIVDDHPIVRQGLTQLLNAEPDLCVCGEAEEASRAYELANKLQPDLVVADITMPGRSGIELIKDLLAVRPGLPVLVLSMHDESFYADRVLRAGGRGYVMKGEGGQKLIEAIRCVLTGSIYLSPQFSTRLIEQLSSKKRDRANPVSGVEQLSSREFEVFQAIASGKTTREIANALHLSVKTIEVHRLNIKRKLGLETATALLRFAVQWTERESR